MRRFNVDTVVEWALSPLSVSVSLPGSGPPKPPGGLYAFETQPACVSFPSSCGLFRFGHLDLEADVVDTVCVAEGLVEADLVLCVEVEERRIECLTPFLGPLQHRFFERIHLAFLDEFLNTRGIQQDLQGGHAPAIRTHYQPLGDDRAQIERQLQEKLRVPRLGEKVDDALERLVGIG